MMFWHDYNMGWWGLRRHGHRYGAVLGADHRRIVALIRFGNGSANTTATPPPRMRQAISPEQVLADRFARAEIDATEYQRRIEVLRNHARQ